MTQWMEELQLLGELRDKGLITDEEFEAFRIKIVPSPNEMESPLSEELITLRRRIQRGAQDRYFPPSPPPG